jgi:hypothetical protein
MDCQMGDHHASKLDFTSPLAGEAQAAVGGRS